MKNVSKFIIVSAIACIIACIGEFVTIFILGEYFPGYSQIKDTMSALGASNSPVSNVISAWWVIMGILVILFGIGVRLAFAEKGSYAKTASWLIVLYGIGEGIGSGAFKADHVADGLTTSLIIHDIVGGIGVTAILILPLIMKKLVSKTEMSSFYRMSGIIFITGILTILLFLFRYLPNNNNFFSTYKGFWQRLFMLNTYIYFIAIAVVMVRKQKKS